MDNKKKLTLFALSATFILASAAWAQTEHTLRYKGSIVSQDVRLIDGRAYVPLADVAHLLSASTTRAGTGYILQSSPSAPNTPAGGANEVHGLQGTIGQMVFTGKWRFEVLQVEHLAQYATKLQPTTRP